MPVLPGATIGILGGGQLGQMLALAAARGLKQRVKLYLCCADNMVSGNAFKLGDIIRYRNGKTVEVMNTDAEGRLVLADALALADAELDPALLVEDTVTAVVQVKGKVRDTLEVPADITAEDLEARARASQKVRNFIGDAEIVKVIVREPKLVNLVIR